MVSLYDNTPDSTWVAQFWATTTRGVRFQASAAGYATGFRWYRPATGSVAAPVGLNIWNTGTASLWSASSGIVDSGSAGWQVTPIDPPLALAAATTYVLGVYIAGSTNFPRSAESARGPAPAPLLFDDIGEWYYASGHGYPLDAQDGYMVPVDIVWSASAPVPPEPDPGDPATAGDLSRWLSADPAVQTHETDGLPWHIGLVVDALTTTVNNIGAAIGHVADAASTTGSLMARVAQLLLDTAAILARIPADILSSIEQFVSWISSWFGDAPRPEGTPTLPAQLNEVWGRSLWIWHRLETAHWIDAVPGGDWVLQDTLDWDGPIGWNQPADCYVFRITAAPERWSSEDIDGHIRYLRAAWWMPLSDTLPHDRHSADMDVQILEVLPRRCQGILLRPSEGFAGTLEAWLRPDPPTS